MNALHKIYFTRLVPETWRASDEVLTGLLGYSTPGHACFVKISAHEWCQMWDAPVV